MSLQPGDKLGPYTLLDRLGSGGMGEVWKARATRLDRTVAIKRLLNQHASPTSAARFQQEARAIAALNHPKICQIHDVGPDYLVLEYIEGKPLVSKENTGPIPADDAIKIALQIAPALEEAHGDGITHRDLKPDNILVTASGVKLLDFGLAKIAPHTGAAGATPVPDGATLTMGLTEAGAIQRGCSRCKRPPVNPKPNRRPRSR